MQVLHVRQPDALLAHMYAVRYPSFFLCLLKRKNYLSFVYVLWRSTRLFFLCASGRSTNSVMDSDDSLSYTVPIVGFTVTLQSI